MQELRALLLAWRARVSELEEAIADKVPARRTRAAVPGFLAPKVGEQVELPTDKRHWLLASMWEVVVGLGRDAKAAGWEQQARALKPPDWMLKSAEDQLLRVRQTQVELGAVLAELVAARPE